MNQINENIYLGSRDDADPAKLKDTPVTAVLNVAQEVPHGSGGDIKWHKVGMKDSAEAILHSEDAAIAKLSSLLDSGEIVLVHCRHGKSRSSHIVAECISRRTGEDYFKVYERIRQLRPQVLAYSVGQEIIDKRLLK